MKDSIYFLGDLHFGHLKAAELRGFNSVNEHDDYILGQIRETVPNGAKIYLMGDVCFYNPSKFIDAWKDKIGTGRYSVNVILGNHDDSSLVSKSIKSGVITKFYSSKDITVDGVRFLLTHIPVHESSLERFGLNIHAHMHDKKIDDPRYICTSWEQKKGLISIQEILEMVKK